MSKSSGNKLKYDTAGVVIKTLIQGIDPATSEPLPPDSIVNRPDVLRALLTATSTLEEASAHTARRALLPGNVGQSWSLDEEARLVNAYKAGDPVEKIAMNHGRTLRAIEARLEKLGLIAAGSRRTNTSFLVPPSVKEEGE